MSLFSIGTEVQSLHTPEFWGTGTVVDTVKGHPDLRWVFWRGDAGPEGAAPQRVSFHINNLALMVEPPYLTAEVFVEAMKKCKPKFPMFRRNQAEVLAHAHKMDQWEEMVGQLSLTLERYMPMEYDATVFRALCAE